MIRIISVRIIFCAYVTSTKSIVMEVCKAEWHNYNLCLHCSYSTLLWRPLYISSLNTQLKKKIKLFLIISCFLFYGLYYK